MITIIVKKGETVVGHVLEGLCQLLFTKLFNDGCVNISAEIMGPPRPSSNGIFVKGGGIEVPCSYKLHRSSDRKVEVRFFFFFFKEGNIKNYIIDRKSFFFFF